MPVLVSIFMFTSAIQHSEYMFKLKINSAFSIQIFMYLQGLCIVDFYFHTSYLLNDTFIFIQV